MWQSDGGEPWESNSLGDDFERFLIPIRARRAEQRANLEQTEAEVRAEWEALRSQSLLTSGVKSVPWPALYLRMNRRAGVTFMAPAPRLRETVFRGRLRGPRPSERNGRPPALAHS